MSITIILLIIGLLASPQLERRLALLRDSGENTTHSHPSMRIGVSAPLTHSPLLRTRLAGQVIEAGEPVANARVAIGMPHSATAGRVVETTDDGIFDLEISPSPVIWLAVDAAERATVTMRVRLDDPTTKTDELVVELEPCDLGERWTIVTAEGSTADDAIVRGYVDETWVTTMHADHAGQIRFCSNGSLLNYAISAEGYGTTWIGYHEVADGGVVQLSPGGSLTGIVTDRDRNVMSDVRVVARPAWLRKSRAETQAQVTTTTNRQGTFTIDDLRPGRYIVETYANDISPPSEPISVVVRANTIEQVSLVAENGVVVRGVVLHDHSAEPGVELRMEGCASAISQEDGRFATRCLSLSGPRSVRADGYLVEPSDLRIEEATDDVVLVVHDQPLVTGRVFVDGVPVSGAIVGVSWFASVGRVHESSLYPNTRSDTNGRYTLALPRPGIHTIVAFDPVRSISSDSVTVELTRDSEQSKDLRLNPDGRGEIQGRLLDRVGNPISEATITVNDEILASTVSRDGTFDLRGLSMGTHTLKIELAGNDAWSDPIRRAIEISADEPCQSATIHVDRVRQRLQGRVIYDDGNPVVGASVSFAGASVALEPLVATKTDAQGRFTLYTYGTARIVATTTLDEFGWVAVDGAETTDIELTISRAGSIVGVVSVPDGTRVHLSGALSPEEVLRETMGHAGDVRVHNERFEFRSVQAGTYRVSASVGTTVFTNVAVVLPGAETVVELADVEGSTISGRVSSHDSGKAVAGALCGRTLVGTALSDEEGVFQLPSDAVHGTIVLFCRHANAVGATAVRLTPGTAAQFDIPLVERGRAGRLGAELARIDSATIAIRSVQVGSSADRAGVSDDDFVVGVDNLIVTEVGADFVTQYVAAQPPGTALLLDIERDGQEWRVSVVLDHPL